MLPSSTACTRKSHIPCNYFSEQRLSMCISSLFALLLICADFMSRVITVFANNGLYTVMTGFITRDCEIILVQ